MVDHIRAMIIGIAILLTVAGMALWVSPNILITIISVAAFGLLAYSLGWTVLLIFNLFRDRA